MPRYSTELVIDADDLDHASLLAADAAEFLGAAHDGHIEVGIVCIWEPPDPPASDDYPGDDAPSECFVAGCDAPATVLVAFKIGGGTAKYCDAHIGGHQPVRRLSTV